jgi:hypothetical protein
MYNNITTHSCGRPLYSSSLVVCPFELNFSKYLFVAINNAGNTNVVYTHACKRIRVLANVHYMKMRDIISGYENCMKHDMNIHCGL